MSIRSTKRTLLIALVVLVVVGLAYADQYFASRLLDSKGGNLAVKGARLVVPRGALDEPTLISIRVSAGENSIEYEFGPHDTEFNVPVKLVLNWALLKDVSREDIILYYYDEEVGAWVEETRAIWDDNLKIATLYLNHFSRYYFERR